ncbi:unnamed protein product [Prorocentrum cordatum]|uniref:Uncharacterized protein n=1 Tax=Prorocentrum cordatum TaxID=2364126 RepID=A0ABN9T0A0_9DINO|nr:unnamed protein product [Polarella glacialis]
MRVRRLRRYQTMIAHQWRNGQILTSMLGHFSFEDTPTLIGGDLKKDVSTVKKLLIVLTKLSLTNAAEIREITGMLWNTVLVEVKSPIVVEMMAQGKSCHEKSKKAKGDPAAQDRLGPPYVHIFAGLMLGPSKTEPQLEETHTNSLTEFWTQQVTSEGKTPLDLLGKVMHCKCKAAKVKDGEPGLAKVTIAMSMEFGAVQVAILAALVANGGIKKHGPAPRGPLERAAQELLEALNLVGWVVVISSMSCGRQTELRNWLLAYLVGVVAEVGLLGLARIGHNKLVQDLDWHLGPGFVRRGGEHEDKDKGPAP